MLLRKKRPRPVFSLGAGAFALCLFAAVLLHTGEARASGPPLVGATWSSAVFSSNAHLEGEVNPNGLSTGYHFDYITEAAYEANLAASREPFTGALRSPPSSNASLGSGTSTLKAAQLLSSLSAGTAYRYRLVATNSAATVIGATHAFMTQSTGGGVLLDSRGWEMVSPVDKNGGRVDPPGAIAGGGVLQAAGAGGAVTYGSATSFAGGSGAPPASQYLATRGGGGWSTENITAPIFSGTYATQDEGVSYQLFSPDLSRAILLNGIHCRGEEGECAVANPPLAGTEAPEGYQDYYLRETGGFSSLLSPAAVSNSAVDPAHFDLRFAGASPDLRHVVLSSCAKLAANATEVAQGEGCDATKPNLYEYSPGGGLSLVNLLPGDTTGTPGASLAAQAAAVSEDGSRIYFSEEGSLYLREGAQTKLVAEGAGFQAASADAAVAFYTTADEHLHRYSAAGAGSSVDLTPSGGVKGVLGADAAGATVYYQDATGLRRWHSGTTTVAAGAEAARGSDWPPATGTARVSADGTKLLFVSNEALTEYDNTDLKTHEADSQVFLYDATEAGALTCVSCNPTGERPLGPSSIPGAVPNGTAEGSTDSYKPRVLSADGRRVFFDSRDAVALSDTNNDADAYEWEAAGDGSCSRAGGCVALISSGRSTEGATFVDASADGSDAYFLTDGSLVGTDPGAVDLYDARVGGGFPEPVPPIVCEGDNCQALPPEPVDPTLTTLLAGPGNPPVRFPVTCKKGTVKRHGQCVKKRRRHKPKRHRKGGRGR